MKQSLTQPFNIVALRSLQVLRHPVVWATSFYRCLLYSSFQERVVFLSGVSVILVYLGLIGYAVLYGHHLLSSLSSSHASPAVILQVSSLIHHCVIVLLIVGVLFGFLITIAIFLYTQKHNVIANAVNLTDELDRVARIKQLRSDLSRVVPVTNSSPPARSRL